MAAGLRDLIRKDSFKAALRGDESAFLQNSLKEAGLSHLEARNLRMQLERAAQDRNYETRQAMRRTSKGRRALRLGLRPNEITATGLYKGMINPTARQDENLRATQAAEKVARRRALREQRMGSTAIRSNLTESGTSAPSTLRGSAVSAAAPVLSATSGTRLRRLGDT